MVPNIVLMTSLTFAMNGYHELKCISYHLRIMRVARGNYVLQEVLVNRPIKFLE